MNITKHTSINRYGKYEYPFTAELDSGEILNAVIFSESGLTSKALDDNIDAHITKFINKPEPEQKETLDVDEVETVLKAKGLMEAGEKWETWKDKKEAKVV